VSTPTSTRRDVRWVGLAPEARRAERRRLLLDAGYELLGTEGWTATTVRGVCQAARLNPRYFYESFDDIDALVVAVYDRVVTELTDDVRRAQDAAPPDRESQLRAAIDRIVGFIDEDRRRGRILYVEALGNEALNKRRIETSHSLVDVVERDAAAHHGEPPPGEVVGKIAASILVGGFSELLAGWLDGRLNATRAQLVDDATALFLALGDAAIGIAGSRAPTRQRAVRRRT
jgi:AcrR family transcriptional regulator